MNAALLIVRLIAGLGFAAHGTQKLFGWFEGGGISGTGAFFESIGFRPGSRFAVAAGLGEFLGGVLLAFGLGGPIGPALMIAVMLVAILTVHKGHGFFTQNGGAELPLMYIAVALTVAVAGPGHGKGARLFESANFLHGNTEFLDVLDYIWDLATNGGD